MPCTAAGSPWKADTPSANQHRDPAESPHRTPPRGSGREPAQPHALRPCLAQDGVDPVRAPDAEHRDHAAAADVDQVLAEQVLARLPATAALAPEQREVRRLGAGPEVLVEADHVVV